MTKISNKYIELFAGCGGLSIGLESAGFDLLFANEISPMAGETFAYNILNEDLQNKARNKFPVENVIWLASQYDNNDLGKRLRENPLEAKKGKFEDFSLNNEKFKGNKLFIGDLNILIDQIKSDKKILDYLQSLDIDLVSGGPPCQSFSLAGLREKNNHRNTLPLRFVQFASLTKPKVVLLENVEGITAPFKDENKSYYAWLEIAKAFALESYYPICMLVNSKLFGIPQNRPRFLLIALRSDIFTLMKSNVKDENSRSVLRLSEKFANLCLRKKTEISNVTISDFKLFELEKEKDRKYFNGEILPKFVTQDLITVSEAIDDIKSVKEEYNLNELNKGYSKMLNTILNRIDDDYLQQHFLENHCPRKHNDRVKSRFRLYQLLNRLENGQRKIIQDAIKGRSIDTKEILKILKNYKIFIDGKRIYLKTESEIGEYFELIRSKKQTQRALIPNQPSPAQLTIPDDGCHYDKNQLRTLTVREMARIQTFPDWFEFKSKVTTGGSMRKFEVPQYTQVGNAVPPLLAYKLGLLIKNIISNVDGAI